MVTGRRRRGSLPKHRWMQAVVAIISALAMTGLVGLADAARATPGIAQIGPGSENTNGVTCIQKALSVDPSPAPYGTFGSITYEAVKSFQAEHGLPQIGRVGPATGDLLLPIAPPGCIEYLPSTGTVVEARPGDVPLSEQQSYSGCPLLLEGQTSDCVRRLQRDLNAVSDSYDLPVTGFFGPKTRAAVLDFQGRNRLPADGNVGRATADLLVTQVIARDTPPTSPAAPAVGGAQESRYRIELKAWIPHDALYIVPPGAQICQPWVPGTKAWYDGDGHNGYPGDYRVLVSYEFLWNGNTISEVSVDGAYGETALQMAGPLPNMQCENRERASSSYDVQAEGNSVILSMSSANPLQAGSPTIDSKLTATLVSVDEMRVKIQTDKFPSHGFAVYRNGEPIATVVEFDASCVPSSGPRAAGLIANRLQSFEHEEQHGIDLRVRNQEFFGPCEQARPESLSFPAD